MQREVPFSIEGIGLVPEHFYRDAERAIALLPDEWDVAVIHPHLVWDEDSNDPVEYGGAACHFEQAGRAVRFLVDAPSRLLDDQLREQYIRRVRHAFEKATA